MGAVLMTRRTIIDQVGPLNERIFMSLEDTEYCWRVGRAGWRVEYLPSVTVTHHGGRSARLNLGTALTEYYRSEMYFVGISHHWSGALVHRLLLIAECSTKGLVTLGRIATGNAKERIRLGVYRKTLLAALRPPPGLEPSNVKGIR